MLRSVVSALMCAVFVMGCTTSPPAPPSRPAVEQVQLPAVSRLPDSVILPSFTERMGSFLSTKQAGPKRSESNTSTSSTSTSAPEKR